MSRLQIVRGLPFPKIGSLFSEERILETLDYVPKDGDIVIASYPKTGTTWLQYIVLQITSKGEIFPDFQEAHFKLVPFMEMTGASAIEEMKGLRIYKHHYPYNMVQKNIKAKYLYIYRNPEDIVISFYYFLQKIRKHSIDFEKFFEEFITGNIEYGSYFKHISSFLAHKNDKNILFISYEKLHAHRKEGFLRIAKFLGEEYFQCLSNDDSILDAIIERTSFDYMKENLSEKHQGDEDGSLKHTVQAHKFFRKGIVGDGKSSLSSNQLKRLREVTSEAMKGTEILNEWTEQWNSSS